MTVRYAVLVEKASTGKRVVFATYDSQVEAESTAKNLRAFMPTPVAVERVPDAPIRPGTTFRPRLVKGQR